MVTNGDRKTNSFGKLVRQKVGLFSSWFSARGARSGWRPRGRRSATAVQDAGREQGRARRLGSDAFGHEGAQTSNVDGSVVKRSTVPGREGEEHVSFAVHGAARVQEQLRDQGRARRLKSDEFAHIFGAHPQTNNSNKNHRPGAV